jgi:hypothetical protein
MVSASFGSMTTLVPNGRIMIISFLKVFSGPGRINARAKVGFVTKCQFGNPVTNAYIC